MANRHILLLFSSRKENGIRKRVMTNYREYAIFKILARKKRFCMTAGIRTQEIRVIRQHSFDGMVVSVKNNFEKHEIVRLN